MKVKKKKNLKILPLSDYCILRPVYPMACENELLLTYF